MTLHPLETFGLTGALLGLLTLLFSNLFAPEHVGLGTLLCAIACVFIMVGQKLRHRAIVRAIDAHLAALEAQKRRGKGGSDA